MDYFTKNKMIFWLIAILVILNAVTLTTFWMHRPGDKQLDGFGAKADGQAIMQQKLNLSQEQGQQFEQIRNEHFARTRPLQDDMHKIKMDMLDKIFQAEPDEAKIKTLQNALSEKQSQFDQALFVHFEQLKDACNGPEQKKELRFMLTDLIERTRPAASENRRPMRPGPGGPRHRPPPRH